MSDTAHAPASNDAAHGHDAHGHPDSFYIRIWGILLVMLVISVAGPELAHRVVSNETVAFIIVLFTAFGIAIVKAYMVVKNFMHIGVEKKYVGYLLVTMLILMGLMLGGVGPDVLRHEGHRWVNQAAKDYKLPGDAEHGAPHEAHGEPASPVKH
ncbi:MAG: cytochrome C oxidase subunit IV family protein [Myxococcaceae bacterium]|jgi:caa(3)-type oxidase subunit IV|nr:cytochrome C oxidase subunit IV family protein [Myxococcaceae bacterium]